MTRALAIGAPEAHRSRSKIGNDSSNNRDPNSSWHRLSAPVLGPTEHAAEEEASSPFPSSQHLRSRTGTSEPQPHATPFRSLQSQDPMMTVPEAAGSGGGHHQDQQGLGATNGAHGRTAPGSPFREAEDSSRSFVILMVGATTLLAAIFFLRAVRRWLPDFVLQWSQASGNDPRGAFTTYMRQQERERREELRRNRKREDPVEKRERLVKCLEGCAMEVKESDLVAAEPPVPPLDEDARDLEYLPCEGGGQHDNGGTALCLRGRRTVPNCCAVCLSSYEAGEEVLWSNNPECQHAFHRECILSWLVRKRAYDDDEEEGDACPCCRGQFVICRGGKGAEAEDGESSLDAKGAAGVSSQRITSPSPPPSTSPDAPQSLPPPASAELLPDTNGRSVDETSARLDPDTASNEATSSQLADDGRPEVGGGDTLEGSATTDEHSEESISDVEEPCEGSDGTSDTSGVDVDSHGRDLDAGDDPRLRSFSSSNAPTPAEEEANEGV